LRENKWSGIAVIKSTVLPGTCDELQSQFPELSLCHNPEFLTEARAYEDFCNQSSILIGGAKAQEVADLYMMYFNVPVLTSASMRTTELAKYMHNVLLSVKVGWCNEFYHLCQFMEADYGSVRDMAVSVGVIGASHTRVPGPDGKFGFGGACLVPGTVVHTDLGPKLIEDVRVGEALFDGNGYTPVTRVGSRYVDSLIEISSCGRVFCGSPDHIHMIYEGGALKERLLSDVNLNDWVFIPTPMESYKGEIALPPKPNNYCKWWPESIAWSDELAYIVGLWLADGCRSPSESAVSWSLGVKKDEVRARLVSSLNSIGLNCSERYSESEGTYGVSRVWIVRLRSMGFDALLDQIGVIGTSFTKRFPRIPTEFIPSCVAGWLDGDGSTDGGSVTGFSRSVEMIKDIDRALLRIGINANISKDGQQINISMRADAAKILAHTTRLKIDSDRYARQKPNQSPNKRNVDGGWITRVTKVEQKVGGKVISLETESEKYVANNLLTHNCFPKDTMALHSFMANRGLQRGILSAACAQNAERNEEYLSKKGKKS
jgi:UDP-glucose 6-dehydrogenase